MFQASSFMLYIYIVFPVPIQKLIAHFQKLPGVGPRQATRFALRLSKMAPAEVQNLAKDLGSLKESIAECKECFLLFERRENNGLTQTLCQFCKDDKRDHKKICVVANDHDALVIEKTKAFGGLYHILGGHISLLKQEINKNLNLTALKQRLELMAANDSAEVILALNATIEGQATALYLEKFLTDSENFKMKISRLAQGLSSGSEIEYVDDQTLIHAFRNRK